MAQSPPTNPPTKMATPPTPEPWDPTSIVILFFMAFLCCFTITQYCFQHDAYLSHNEDSVQHDNTTYLYGPPNAEFDWCERNFLWSKFVAEPVNTVTGLFFIVVPLLGEALHKDLPLPWPAHLTLFFTGLIGIGTVLFHATLRYPAQLLDELPIYYLILLIVLELSDLEARAVRSCVSVWATTLTVLLFAIPQELFLHELVRGIMSCTFTVCFIYTFYKISARASAMKTTTVDAAAGPTDFKPQVQQLFRYSFGFFVVAEVCWLIDNSQCPTLRTSLPFYPHLHAVWHFFAAGGMYGLWCCVLALKWVDGKATGSSSRSSDGESTNVVEVEWCFGVVPRIAVRGREGGGLKEGGQKKDK